MARPISDRHRQWLAGQLDQWLAAGLLQPDQPPRILGHYESPQELADRKRWLVSVTLAGVAVLLMGMAVMLLVGHHWNLVVARWEGLPRLIKIAAVVLVLIAAHGSAWLLRTRTAWRVGSELVFLFAGLMYGSGIWMVAQVFHVNAHWPDGLWWWALGVLPLALCLDSLLLHCLLVGLLAMWAGCETFGFPNSRLFWELLPHGNYSLLLMAGLGLGWCYRKGSLAGVWLYAALAGWWLILHSIGFCSAYGGREEAALFFLVMGGPLFLIWGENHRPGSPLAQPYYVVGTLLTASALIPLGFWDFHEQFHTNYYRMSSASAITGTLVHAGLLSALAVLAAALPLFSTPTAAQQAAGPWARLREILRRQGIPIGVAVAAAWIALWDVAALGQGVLLVTVAGNLAILAVALWLMHAGVRDEHGFVFAAGVIYLLVWAVCRYVDLFAKSAGMLGGALMFFACGMILLALARLWRKREEIFHV